MYRRILFPLHHRHPRKRRSLYRQQPPRIPLRDDRRAVSCPEVGPARRGRKARNWAAIFILRASVVPLRAFAVHTRALFCEVALDRTRQPSSFRASSHWRGSQVVRPGSAKPLFAGSIPAPASSQETLSSTCFWRTLGIWNEGPRRRAIDKNRQIGVSGG